MQIVNFIKQMRARYAHYTWSDMYSLEHAYNSYSYAKGQAWAYCKELCEKYGGFALKVIGKNSCTFSAGFVYHDANGKLHFVYITKDYDKDTIVK